MKYSSKLFAIIINSTWLILFSLLFLWNGEVVEASKDSSDYTYEITQLVPEKETTDEELTSLVYELNHKEYRLSDTSTWEVLTLDSDGNETGDVTDWFEQEVVNDGSLRLTLKDQYLNSSDFYNKEYLIKATLFFEDTSDTSIDVSKESFRVKQYMKDFIE